MVSAGVCILVASMVVFATAQIPSLGWCPEYTPMGEFDIDRFLGKWYEAERYFTLSEVASRCAVTDYARGANGRIFVSSEITNRLTGVKRVFGGKLELSGKGNEGKMNVKYTTTSPLSTESTLLVLDTDYDNFAVVWSCSGIGPIHTQNAWLMTRERIAPDAVLQRAYGVLDDFQISRTFFVKTDQQGCSVGASDINAANGITSTSTVPQALGTKHKLNTSGSNDQTIVKTSIDSSPEEEETREVPKDAPKETAQETPNEAPKEAPKEEKSAEEEKVKPETIPEHILNSVVHENAENSEKKIVQEQN